MAVGCASGCASVLLAFLALASALLLTVSCGSGSTSCSADGGKPRMVEIFRAPLSLGVLGDGAASLFANSAAIESMLALRARASALLLTVLLSMVLVEQKD